MVGFDVLMVQIEGQGGWGEIRFGEVVFRFGVSYGKKYVFFYRQWEFSEKF